MREIPILLYHNVGDYPEIMMTDGVSMETFRKQMRFLQDKRYHFISLDQAVDAIVDNLKLPSNSISITIDGGYLDAYTNIFPILKEHDIPATFFIPPGFVGKEWSINGSPIDCSNWGHIGEMVEHGMDIGLLAYPGKGIKGAYDESTVKQSIEEAFSLFENPLKESIRYCAFKEGVPSNSLWDYLTGLGFRAVFTQCPTYRKPSPQGIGRIQIDDDDHNIFLTKISKTYLFFKDKRSWDTIRKYRLDRLGHHISESINRIRHQLEMAKAFFKDRKKD